MEGVIGRPKAPRSYKRIKLSKDPLTERVYIYNDKEMIAAINKEILLSFLQDDGRSNEFFNKQ